MKEEGCPEPSFEISDENIVCRLPAHPRHQTAKALQEVQSLVSLGRFTEAEQQITELLQADPHNFRTLSLFCEIQRSLQQHHRVYDFVRVQQSALPSFPSSLQLLFADILLDSSQHGQSQEQRDAKDLAMRLFSLASRTASEEDEMRRIAVGFLRLKEEQKALDCLVSFARSQPH